MSMDFTKDFRDMGGEVVIQSHRYRCMLFGCHYGVEKIDATPMESCMFCGEKRKEPHLFYGVSEIQKMAKQK